MAELRTFPRSSQRFHSKFVRRGYRSIERSFDSTSPKKKKTLALARVVFALPIIVSITVGAMIAHRARDLSPVLGLLLPLILVANGHEFVTPENEVDVNPSNVSSSILNHKMEPRTDGDSSINWSVERKSGGPFSYRRDSYLEALRHSRTSTDPREGIVDAVGTGSFQRRKEQSLGPVYTTKRSEITPLSSSSSRIVHGNSFSMVPSDSYSLPSRTSVDFNGVKSTYGPPQPSYGSPSIYGPPPSSNDYSSYGEYGTNGGGYSPHQPQQGETRGIVLGSVYRFHVEMDIEYSSSFSIFRSSLWSAARDIRVCATLPSVHRLLVAVRAQAERLHPCQDTSQAGHF